MLIASRLNIKEIDIEHDQLVGPFCLPLPSDEFQLEASPKILECPWKSSEDFKVALQEIGEAYEDILAIFSDILDIIHNLNTSTRFWRILIGPWLYWVINVIYDNYHRLLKAQKENIGNLLIPEGGLFNVPQDTFDFVASINHSDYYNLQILHSVARYITYPISYSAAIKPKKLVKEEIYGGPEKLMLKIRGYKIFSKLFCRYSDIHLYQSGHSPRFILGLFFKSKGKILEANTLKPNITYPGCDLNYRDKLLHGILDRLSNKNGFLHKLLCAIAVQQIPICFLEGFEVLKAAAENQFGLKIPKKIASSIAWYCDEEFKLWAANCALKGTALIGLQHGGNYGISRYIFTEDHEVGITDKYLSWGWQSSGESSKIFASPAQKLLDIIPCIAPSKISDEILYVGKTDGRFVIQFPSVPELFFKSFEDQLSFIETLPKKLLKKVRFRLHKEDNIWEIQKRLSKKFENLRFETWDVPFRKSILNAKIVICDNLSTTFIEVLASKIPVILFFDEDTTLIRDSAVSYFDSFEKVGILHRTAKQAASFLAQVEDNIQAWWNDCDVQEVVEEFLFVFAKRSEHPLNEWNNLLLNI